MLTKRQIMILMILMENNGTTTGKELATALSLSEKTVLTELKSINLEMKQKNYGSITRRRGVGIQLEFKDSLSQKRLLQDCHAFSTDDDFAYLLKQLFMKSPQKIITEKKLKQELFVSRNYLLKKINFLNKTCHNYQVEISSVKNQGLIICGSEFNIRDAIIELFSREYLFPAEVPGEHSFFTSSQEEHFRKIFGDFNKAPLENLLVDMEKTKGIRLDHFSRNTLLMHLVLAVVRDRLGCQITYTENQQNYLKTFPTELLNDLKLYLTEHYKNVPNHDEIIYIYLYLDIYGLLSHDSFNKKRSELRASIKFNEFTESFLNLMEGILDIDLIHDKTLRSGICNHLSAAIVRLMTNIRIHNPLLYEVKQNFSLVYKTTWASSLLLDQYYNITINEDEIAYIALYIGIAKEKSKQEINACLFVKTEDHFSKILKEQIKNIHPSLSVTCVVSPNTGEAFDLIITPLHTQSFSTDKIIQIGNILSENDKITILSKVKELIDKMILSKELIQEKNSSGFDQQFIFLNYPQKPKNEIIGEICSLLEKGGYVYKKYAQSVIKREASVSTEIGSLVAIPHGNSKLVKRSVIAYINLDQPIPWTDSDMVKHIFFLVISEINDQATEKTIRNFYKILISITEVGSLSQLDQMESKDAVIDFFTEKIAEISSSN